MTTYCARACSSKNWRRLRRCTDVAVSVTNSCHTVTVYIRLPPKLMLQIEIKSDRILMYSSEPALFWCDDDSISRCQLETAYSVTQNSCQTNAMIVQLAAHGTFMCNNSTISRSYYRNHFSELELAMKNNLRLQQFPNNRAHDVIESESKSTSQWRNFQRCIKAIHNYSRLQLLN